MDSIFSEDVECAESIADVTIYDSNTEFSINNKNENKYKYSISTPNRGSRLLEFTEIVNSIHSDKKIEPKECVVKKTKRSKYRNESDSEYTENEDDSDWEESEISKKKRLHKDKIAFKQSLQHVNNLFKLVDKIGNDDEVEILPMAKTEEFIESEWPINVKIVLLDQFGKLVRDSKLEKVQIQKDDNCENFANELGKKYGLDESLWNLIKVKFDDEIVDKSTIFGDGTLDLEEGVQIDVIFPQINSK